MPLMKCGHAANAVQDTPNGRKPACVICAGISPGWDEIDESQPSLEGRESQCSYCKRKEDSDLGLAFFEYRPNKEHDKYYCGCRGWD